MKKIPTESFDVFRKIAEPLAQPAPAIPPGATVMSTIFGKYRIKRLVGRGASGMVFEAEDPELKRTVALKILRDVVASSANLRERFRREAQSSARIAHPHVVQVFDAGELDGNLFLVMEFVKGRTLIEVIGARKSGLRPMLELLEKVARGVASAHAAGIVHRDLKPGNIMVTETDEPKITDFGLAYWMDSEESLTKTGTPMGTPKYMAPEQVRGESDRVCPATDVYALGVILYEIVAGRPPFIDDTLSTLYARILGEEPQRFRAGGTHVDSDLEVICLKALEKQPEHRYPGAAEFADDLGRFIRHEPIQARPPGPVRRVAKRIRRHPRISAAIAVGAILAITLGAYASTSSALRRQKWALEVKTRLDAAARIRDEHGRLEEDYGRSYGELRRLKGSLSSYDPADLKMPYWKAWTAQNDAYLRLPRLAEDVVLAYAAVLSIDPGNSEARGALADFHFSRFERAEKADDKGQMDIREKYVRLYDDLHRYDARLSPTGDLTLDSQPPGAEVELFRYEERLFQRLTPERIEPPSKLPLTARSLRFGSYLARIRKEGYREVRYPFRIERGKKHEAVVKLYTDAEIGPRFVYVPAGRFRMGGDDNASPDAFTRADANTGDYFISRHEVTMGEYIAFIEAIRISEGEEAARRHSPRWIVRGDTPQIQIQEHVHTRELSPPQGWEADMPVVGVSVNDAAAYAAWLTAASRRRGEAVTYRLPTSLEWQKAARGADDRVFPWGNKFDWAFTVGGGSTTNFLNARPAAVGSEDDDESPYGVRDLAGNASEWTGDAVPDSGAFKIFGGHYRSTDEGFFHVTGSVARTGPDVTSPDFGFRLVKVRVDKEF